MQNNQLTTKTLIELKDNSNREHHQEGLCDLLKWKELFTLSSYNFHTIATNIET